MSAINSVLMTERHYEYRNRKGADRGKSLFERVGRADAHEPENRVGSGRLSPYDAYICMNTRYSRSAKLK